MNNTGESQHSFMILKRQLIFVIFICYFPHISTEPVWLFILFLAAMTYRLVADYFSLPTISRWIRFLFFIGCLAILYRDMFSDGFFIRCLLAFIILKFLEIRTTRDLNSIILCNFFLIFAALTVVDKTWIFAYLFIAVLANLSIMLRLSASEASLRQIGSKSGQLLLIAIPLSIFLFYFFPRVAPLWKVPSLSRSTTGFNNTMSPGSIAKLFDDNSTAMQITFKKTPIVDGYWRGIVLSFYNGESWESSWYKHSSFLPLNKFKANESADYEIILEPNQSKWLFYEGNPVAGDPDFLFSPAHGLIRQNKQPITQRFIYSLKVQPASYHVLSPVAYTETTQLPKNLDPRLDAWSKAQFAKSNNDIKTFITFLQNYIHQQPFWYTLSPPPIDADKNQMDTFWFDTQKGFCEHFASAVAYILRAAGIPARVIIGYQGGQWNPISQALTLEQSDAHAWVEYWLAGIGWQEFDPTSFVANERVEQSIQNRETLVNQENNVPLGELSLNRKFEFYIEYAQLFYDRWFLFYNQNSQHNLLQNVGLGKWKEDQLMQVSIGSLVLFFVLLELAYRWRQKRMFDALLREYYLLQNEFRKFNIITEPSSTLKQQCNSLVEKVPALTPVLSTFMNRYEQLRLMKSAKNPKENKKETIELFKALRFILRRTQI